MSLEHPSPRPGGAAVPPVAPAAGPRDVVPLGEATRAWFAISLQTFGGPAGQIAVMQRVLVEEKRWVGQRRFLFALSYCTLLPGPEAQQLATYVGWRSEEHTSELQSRQYLVCRLLLEKK